MKYWFLWLIAGIISLIGGIAALANPLAATITAEQLTAWAFIIVGVMSIISVFAEQGWGSRILSFLVGIVILLVGINLLNNPLEGVLSLTYGIAILLFVVGMFRIILAFGSEIGNLRWILVLSGVISLVLGGMILANFPEAATVVLGVYLAIELISTGISLIVLALDRRTNVPVPVAAT